MIKYADFLTQFELLYRDTIMFEMESKNRGFLKNELKDTCFSTLKSYSFDKVEKNLSEAESIALKNFIERKGLVIQKADKDKTVVITNRTKYLERRKSLRLDSSKFIQLPIDESKLLNYIINLECKLKDRFKVLKGALLSLIQFLATESPLKVIQNAFYFRLKALFILKILKFMS